jgi:hypothetical protein
VPGRGTGPFALPRRLKPYQIGQTIFFSKPYYEEARFSPESYYDQTIFFPEAYTISPNLLSSLYQTFIVDKPYIQMI